MREQKDLPRGEARSLNGETWSAAVRWVVDAGILAQWSGDPAELTAPRYRTVDLNGSLP